MNSSDEDERFLYGSDEEGAEAVSPSENKNKRPLTQPNDEEETKKPKVDSTEDNAASSSSSDENSSENEESDEDSDVEFIIGVGADSSKLDSKKDSATAASGPKPTTIAPPATNIGSAAVETEATAGLSTAAVDADAGTSAAPGTERLPAIDLNAVGKLGDQPITDIDPEVLKEKPWRQPGANISDYFNYGFNEQTWMEYLHKQEKLRAEYNPHKMLMGLLALQQQGKLNDSGSDSMGQENAPAAMAPPAFPMGMPPMFGGFPFPFPGMMNNMNPQQKK
ncbi:cleavage polyadenylation factor subunit FIP1 [Lachancea thermotolerans CBS 6340]|uniref:Pre-mRNA polyadenylation factor FIP1 n=1 Tax=Lachancea thermotolerans (strain ATCC 56472 / CBS 6340 / NRRL Y-8284) TaxID=559295 RepID=C5DKT9_LACTC|nr:KLTH0F07458p [Lachancea thermotolerans CBS 6340]CAR24090.1 KLTH0F07458p [Lachancea thermotolerans CBS 6340]